MSLPNQSLTPPRQSGSGPPGGLLPRWFPPLFYLLLACVFLWRSTFTGDVFLPAGLLGYISPYTAKIHSDHLPPWNVLRWDGIAQFYPWRHYAASTLHVGSLPLWNPYQFCGTPFVANSQSAVFYPGNLLFYLLPTARAFGSSALLHLTLAGWFLYLLLRRLSCTQLASLLGGTVYAYCAWQVSWLQLPSFLATSCWFPLLLRQVIEIGGKEREIEGRKRGRLHIPALGGIVGMMLLAGHLQIAFYGLLAGVLLALMLLVRRGRCYGASHAGRMLAAYISGLALGLMLAAPQLLPAIELSGRSHRVGKPTAAGYATYTEYALPTQNLITLLLPDFYGNDDDPDNSYWGFYVKNFSDGQKIAVRHNTAETALYVGIAPLLLSGLALLRGKKYPKTLFFGGLAVFALLMALGTPLNALFYFGIPGFGQSGSPARSLVLWALTVSVLTAFGLDRLRERPASRRELAAAAGGLVFLLAIGLSLAAQALSRQMPGFNDLKVPLLGEALARIPTDWIRFTVVAVGGLFLFTAAARRPIGSGGSQKEQLPDELSSPTPEIEQQPEEQLLAELPSPMPETEQPGPYPLSSTPSPRPLLLPLALLLVILDLFSTGILSNPTAPGEWVYPETPGIKFVRERIGHERVFPVNQRWNLVKAPAAVLPPNGAMVYGLRDVQGYDSLLTGRYKAYANEFARPNRDGMRDASPPEVGNMVFFQDPNAPLVPTTGAIFALTQSPSAPEFVKTLPPPGSPIYDASDEMAVYALPNAQPRARLLDADGSPIRNAHIAYIEDGATRVILDVETPSQATLALADQIYPGWQVQMDNGAVNPAHSTSSAQIVDVFRAVSVPAGRHRVAFRYEPGSFRVGLYLACLALLLMTASISRRDSFVGT